MDFGAGPQTEGFNDLQGRFRFHQLSMGPKHLAGPLAEL